MRFAMLEAKLGMAALLRKFTFSKCAETAKTLDLDPLSILAAPKDGLWLQVVERK